MKVNKAILSVLIFSIGSFSPTFGQLRKPMMSIMSIENQDLIAKINNPIRIVAQQNEPVSIHPLNATFQAYNSEKVPIEIVEGRGYFTIRPDTKSYTKHLLVGSTNT